MLKGDTVLNRKEIRMEKFVMEVLRAQRVI